MFKTSVFRCSQALPRNGTLLRPIARAQSTVAQLQTLQQFQQAVARKNLSVIDFYATWCAPCRAVAPHFDKLSEKHTDVAFYRVDVDSAPDIAGFCGVSAMPTFLFARESKTVGKVVGANLRALSEEIESLQK
ncbi:Thioredoxin-3 [Lachancea thermotolerans]